MEKNGSRLLDKNKKHIIVLYLIVIILIVVNIISNTNIIFDDNKIILKNMDESTQIADKEKTIYDLNKSYTEYYNYIQTAKQEIASAIKDMGVETSNLDSLEKMATNIRNIKNMSKITGSFYLFAVENFGSSIWINTEGYKTASIYNGMINSGDYGQYDLLKVYGCDKENLTTVPTGTLLGTVRHQETVSYDISDYKYIQIYYKYAAGYAVNGTYTII